MLTLTKSYLNKIADVQSKCADRVAAARSVLGSVSSGLLLLDQNTKVGRMKELPEEDRRAYLEMGAWIKQDTDGLFSIYAKTVVPYLPVEGRLRLFHNDMIARGSTFEMYQEIDWEHKVISVTVVCDRGRVVGSARIAEGGSGVDATNPVENAQTSALGRALGFLGYGLLFGAAEESGNDVITTTGGACASGEITKAELQALYVKAEQAGLSHNDASGRPALDFYALGALLRKNGFSTGMVKSLSRQEYQTACALLDARIVDRQAGNTKKLALPSAG